MSNFGSNNVSITTPTVQNITMGMQEVESVRRESKFTLKWTINDFNCSPVINGENLPSVKFEFQLDTNMCFKGHLSICGQKCSNRNCLLELVNTTDKYWQVCCVAKINDDTMYDTYLTNEQASGQFSLYDLSKRVCWLNKDSVNVVICEIVHVSYKQSEQPRLALKMQTPSTLHTDFQQLFKSKKMSDITFEVEKHQIPAHKLILASRSEYFAEMFEKLANQTYLAMKPTICIPDIEPEVFSDILCYIYTDHFGQLHKMPKQLLAASQKYRLESAKSMCETELADKINIDNASELLILADECEAKHLKQRVIDFIAKHCKAVALTVGWKKIMQNHLHLMADVYLQITNCIAESD